MPVFLATHKKQFDACINGDKSPNRNWFNIKNVTNNTADVFIYDEISYWGIIAQDIADEITSLDVEHINLRINSPGGLVFDGTAIHNLFKQHKAKVTVYIDGLAASIASIIAMAGDEIVMAENAMMMIHNPLSFAFGNAEDFRQEADILDQIKETLITSYKGKVDDLDRDKISEMMNAETWMTASEAVDMGFATTTADAREEAASAVSGFDFSIFAKSPKWDLREQKTTKSRTPISLLKKEAAVLNLKNKETQWI